MEPNSKWPLLTTVLLMSALGDPEHLSETLSLMDKLAEVDPTRKNYYRDLRSKLTIEEFLEPNAAEVDLSGKNLTCLRHSHLMAATVRLNLGLNRLRDVTLFQLRHCFALDSLVLDGNPIVSLDFLEVLPKLKSLSVRECGK